MFPKIPKRKKREKFVLDGRVKLIARTEKFGREEDIFTRGRLGVGCLGTIVDIRGNSQEARVVFDDWHYGYWVPFGQLQPLP